MTPSLGILALPYCLRLDGITSGLVLIFAVAFLSEGTMWMLVGAHGQLLKSKIIMKLRIHTQLYCVDTTGKANFGVLGKDLGGPV